MNMLSLSVTVVFFLSLLACVNKITKPDAAYILPERGLCAHRGSMDTYPENTLPAFREAIRSGAHMIEFDVQLTKDNKLVVIHDNTVDRTTNGSGKVSELTLDQIRKLDAGSWKSPDFKGEKVPTLSEVLDIMPLNVWLNIHLKGDAELGRIVAEHVVASNRLHQSFLACGQDAAARAKAVDPAIKICNMDRRKTNRGYVDETIGMKANFIQLRGDIYPGFESYVKDLKANGIRVNYFGTDCPEELRTLFSYGVDFPLVNNITESIKIASEMGIVPLQPLYQ
jgi:glycerophosphoryl diester phosphodiesterase